MSVAGRFRVGCVSSSFVLFALSCSSEPTSPSGTGGSVATTGGVTVTGGSSSGGSTGGTVATGGTVTTPTGGSGGATASTGGSASGGAQSTGGISTSGGASSGGASGGGASGGIEGKGGVGGTQGGATSSTGGSNAGAGGKGATGGAGGASSTGGAAGGASGGSGGASGFTLTSPAWTTQPGCAPDNKAPCGIFPKANTGLNGGKSESPELNWSGAPATTLSYAIILQDLTNIQNGNPFIHWVMWNIPSNVTQLPAGLEKTAMPAFPPGSSQRSYSGNGYVGSGKCGNVYEFVLLALPMATFSPGGTNQTQAATALKATNAPAATLRARSGAPECTE